MFKTFYLQVLNNTLFKNLILCGKGIHINAVQAEKEYKWFQAAKFHKQELNSQIDNTKIAKIWQRIGFCYNLASRQTDSAEKFKKLMQLAAKAYKSAAQFFGKEQTLENKGKNAICFSLFEYSRSWLASNSSQKQKSLYKCHVFGQKAAIAFKKAGDKQNYAKTHIILSRCLNDLVVCASKGEEKIKVAQKGLKSIAEATSDLSILEEDEQITAFSIASFLCYHLANLSEKEEKRKEFEKCSLDYAKKAFALSKQNANHYSIILSMWAKALSTFFFEEKLDTALEYAKEMLKKTSIIRDNYFRGVACYLITYIEYWMAIKEEDIEKRRQLYNETIEYSKAAIKHFQLVQQGTDIAEAYLFYTESYSVLANEIATTKAEKIALSKKAVQKGEKGLESAVRSGSADAMTSLLHALSKAYHYSAKLEPKIERKLDLLRSALRYRKDNIKLVKRSFKTNFWMLGVNMAYAAQIGAELAAYEKDQNTKTTLLKEALYDIKNGVSNTNTWLRTCSVSSLVTVAANYEDVFGGMLTEQYLQTLEKENLDKANKTYGDAAAKFREVGLPSRVAESYWKIARNLDVDGDYQKAAKNFENAFAGYKAAAIKIHQFSDFFLDYASYMKAWSQIELAKHAHNDEEYEIAMNYYEKSSRLLRQSTTWMYLSQNFYAWSLLEQAEALSRKENNQESIETFQKATKFLQESKRILSIKLEEIDKKDERDLVERLIKVTDTRNNYSHGRIAIEEAKVLNKQGYNIASSEKYNKAAAIFEEISQAELREAAREAKPLFYLCQAWQKMNMAEAKSDPILYKEAAKLFKQANEFSSKESASMMTLGHSSFSKALESGTEFETTHIMATYDQATMHMETAVNYYLKAGFETTSNYAKATQRLFDAYVFMDTAKRERDPGKQAKYYSMAEKVLEAAAECFIKAGYKGKTDHVQRLLRNVREKRELALSLKEIFNAPAVTASTATFSTISSSEEVPVGLERFEHVDIQANLVQHETDIKVGDTTTIEIQIINTGKEPVSIVKIQDILPYGFQLVNKPDYCTLEDKNLNMKGKRLNPLKTEEIKITMTPFKPGSIEIKPTIICVDWTGQQILHKPDPAMFIISAVTLPGRISTGHPDLDNLLLGGIPNNYTVILASPSNDTLRQLIKKFLEVGAKKGDTTFYITNEPGNGTAMAEEFQPNFHLFVCNPRADTRVQNAPNIVKLKGVESLSAIDIALTKALRELDVSQVSTRRACIEIISDVLLQHHSVITRKWLSGLLPDLQAKGFTTLAVIDPHMHPPEEVHAILGLFDGEVLVSEKETEKGIENTLRVKKLRNQRYLDNELTLKNKD